MNKIAIPNMGNYSIAFAAIADAMGATPWISPTTPEIVKLGYEVSPDSLCLPFKIFIGHFIKAAEEGVEYAVMVNGNGPCRLTYYRQLLQKILDERGLKMHIFGLGDTGIKPPIIKHTTMVKLSVKSFITTPSFLRGLQCLVVILRS